MIKGVITALVTPFDEFDSVNYDVLGELIEKQIGFADGILLLGTTAETPSLREDEMDKILEYSVQKINKRCQIIVGVCSNNTANVLRLCDKYSKYDIDAYLVITPYYNKANDNGLLKHFKIIADNAKHPIILYNVPKRTGLCLNIKVLRQLAMHENIIGIKEASGDIHYLSDVCSLASEKFFIYCGDDEINLPAISIGCNGLISVLSNVIPDIVKNLFTSYNKGEVSEAAMLHHRYFRLSKLLFIETSPVPLKALMNYLRLDVGKARLPYGEMDKENYDKLITEGGNLLS